MKTIPRFILSLLLAPLAGLTQPTAEGPLGVPALVQQILASHPELKLYEAELAAARAGVRAAGSPADPELSLEFGRRRVSDSAGVLAGEGGTWGASLTQSFEWPGRLALRKAVANRQVELAELGLARFKTALEARASALAYGLHAANTKAAAAREVADRFAALKETFLARDPAGITPVLETRVIEAAELTVQRRATEAALAARRALAELNQLRGVPLDTPLAGATARLAFHAPPETAELFAAARANNFEYRARRLELEQQGLMVRLARHERYPSISVSPYYEQARAGEKETNYGIGVSVPLPLTERSRRGVDVAEARERQAGMAVVLAERELERELLAASETFAAKAAEVARWTPDTVARFREAAELADRHYRLGAVPIGTYVELQQGYLDAVESLLDTEREALEAGFRLQELTGLELRLVEVVP